MMMPATSSGSNKTLENLPFKLFENFRAAGLRAVPVGAAVSVREWDVFDSLSSAPNPLALRRFRRCQ